ncbi:hypothetical protein FRB94_002298 [Tulasnella sp. JGI-2019a]|nr:hypothetical protein FRB93_004438 [Tulasnella sp. JGI-2019a]KAG9004557.1 hypothetical protein FRB94_002298 [Tulasnella sp. JGI-2019a]
MNHLILTRRVGQNTPIPVPVPNTVSIYHTLQPSSQHLHLQQSPVQYQPALPVPMDVSRTSWTPSYAIVPPAQEGVPLAKTRRKRRYSRQELQQQRKPQPQPHIRYQLRRHRQASSLHTPKQPQPSANLDGIKRPAPVRRNSKTTRILAVMNILHYPQHSELIDSSRRIRFLKSAMRNPNAVSLRKKRKKKVPEVDGASFWTRIRSLFGIRPDPVSGIDKRMSKY